MAETTIQTDLSLYSADKIPAQRIPEGLEKGSELGTEFPFTWLLGKRAIVMITELSPDEKLKAKGKKACCLCHCGDIEYEKTSGDVSHLICKTCALSYVRSVQKMQR
jgi:hypothetical protein